ncbi:acetyl-CoA hydrolase/transferase N-terminal domain protein [Clostridioides difficile CD111]|uniref:acetyl-CoA hydrolase/transferase N-terminal domain protein n=1 Tax=Clostridioides difficile TaxID=1496 RepID=UPI00038D37E0|nr:acetyl-CoA hydrolase/transferase N-terminal domain protein [Clostridioides difficile]EQK76705.1 acetyl-CoA hydrolase/transferase N-terminal domain protein [Clostridioides difficile CD111]
MNNEGAFEELSGRLRNKELCDLIMNADEAAKIIEDGMVIGVSGFTPSGYPKAVPLAVSERAKSGEKIKLTVYSGASLGPEVDGAWSEAGIIERRLPYQTNSILRNNINKGVVDYIDMHLSHSTQFLNYGTIPKVDVAIVEALAITEEGNIIPTSGIGNSPSFIKSADKVIVEINLAKPMEMEGMADIYITENPPIENQ